MVFIVRQLLRAKVVKRVSKPCIELLEIFIQVQQNVLHFAVVYRPPKSGMESAFLHEFSTFCEEFSVKMGKLLICGDFNFWIDDPESKPGTYAFLELLNDHNLRNYVTSPTHVAGHVLDLVLGLDDSELQSYLMDICVNFVDNCDSNISNKLDHALVRFRIAFPRPEKVERTFSYREYPLLDIDGFNEFIGEALSLPTLGNFCSDQLQECYNSSISSYLDNDCPVITRREKVRDECPWYTGDINRLRQERRRAEKAWLRLQTVESRQSFCEARNKVTSSIKCTKVEYYKKRVEQCGTDQRKLYKVVHELLGSKLKKVIPDGETEEALAGGFSEFYHEKVKGIRTGIPIIPFNEKFFFPVNEVNTLSKFENVSRDFVHSILKNSNMTFCPTDPIDMKKVPATLDVLADFQHLIINRCFDEGTFPASEKIAIISPELKKLNLDKNLLSDYRPVSHLSHSSKNKERTILNQLTPLLSANKILPQVQSGYRTHHSTETALHILYLYIYVPR